MTRRLLLLLAFLLGGAAAGKPMQWSDLLSRPQPKPDSTIAYGPDLLQHVDLWLPSGAGMHPVVLMVHGGCWQTDVAKADIMNWISDDLRKRGIAVWNIEYRGVDRPGGGYPGTFLDVARASDLLREAGPKYHLRTDRVVAVGHSAGGHLALWLAARGGLSKESPLHSAHPIKLAAAISLGGLPDLRAATIPPGDTCEAEPVHKLTGAPSSARPDVYADTSPAQMVAQNIPVILVNATLDHIAPPTFAEAYSTRRPVRRVTIPDEGHVELITPDTMAWAATLELIQIYLK